MSRYPHIWENNLLSDSGLLGALGPTTLQKLKELHNDEGRFYHNWDHALDVLKAVLQLPDSFTINLGLALAAVFHDVVYSYGQTDNEDNSVLLMFDMIEGNSRISGGAVVLAEQLIRRTRLHLDSTADNTPEFCRDFLDCDLLSIASPCWPIALAFDRAICDEALAAGEGVEEVEVSRVQFLAKLRSKPTIFLGGHYGPSNEWQARVNINRLIGHRHDFSKPRNG